MANPPEIELPPSGTRGTEVPRPIRPLLRLLMGTGDLMFRVGIKVQGRPLLRLKTIGARTGKPRPAVLGWFPDAEESNAWVVVASAAGSPRHPGWAHNLARNPDAATVDVGDGEVPVDVELLTGPEREAVWDRVVHMAPGYSRYTEKTDRELPIFRLTART